MTDLSVFHSDLRIPSPPGTNGSPGDSVSLYIIRIVQGSSHNNYINLNPFAVGFIFTARLMY